RRIAYVAIGDAKIAFIYPFATYTIRRYKLTDLFTQPLVIPRCIFPTPLGVILSSCEGSKNHEQSE
ncbi:MAG: hypothetical protein KDD63_07990, partial [Bacteroidetes bacterium]|nr:hypothetical protein [Bacteroidota bacterium]